MIGTSTGGPQALTRVLTALPADLRAPVVVALHIPAGYTEALASRLDQASKLSIVEAREGLVLEPGMVALAPGGQHVAIARTAAGLCTRLVTVPGASYIPSVDALFESGAATAGAHVLGVVMTGMGNDGLAGARAIASAGGSLIVEDPSTCVVYGMPRSVHEARLGADVVTLDRIAEEIARRV